MMRLILMRHCKSSWSHPGLRDHDRPLNKRGYRSAEALGDWLREKGYLPDLAMISSSLRTMETFEGLQIQCESRYTGSLYHASAEGMMDALKEAQVNVLLMIAHNPGIADFAERIVTESPDHERFWDYPTGATLVADFDGKPSWGAGDVRDFIVPRQLLEEKAG